jgi:hypothetical protein
MKVRDQILACFEEFASELELDIKYGNVLLPCHIISEVHNGFFLNYGGLWIGIFRCQDHWWLYELDEEAVEGLRSPNSEHWINELKHISPIDGGIMQGSIQSSAAAILYMIKEVSEGQDVEPEITEASSLSKEEVTKTLNEAIGLLWASGSKMKYIPLTDSAPDGFLENGMLFALEFEEFRPNQPLLLIADRDQDQWLLSDTLNEDGGMVFAGPISTSPAFTALSIFQLVSGLALSNAKISNQLYNWMIHLDSNFVTPIFMGFLNESVRSDDPEIKDHANYVFRTLLEGYQDFPVPNSSVTKVLDIMRRDNLSF